MYSAALVSWETGRLSMAQEKEKPQALKTQKTDWEFKGTAVAPKTGLVIVYDLENFTSFLETPDIQRAALKYLNHIDENVCGAIYGGGEPFYDWGEDAALTEHVIDPIHRKFLGDGAMMIFDLTNVATAKYQSILHNLINRAWNVKTNFGKLNDLAREFMPTAKMPPRIRIGITFGTMYELTQANGENEYLGIPINMAARLQKYSGKTAFLVSARVDLPPKWFEEQKYIKVRPLKLRNGKNEYLYIDHKDLKAAKKGLFEIVPRLLLPGESA